MHNACCICRGTLLNSSHSRNASTPQENRCKPEVKRFLERVRKLIRTRSAFQENRRTRSIRITSKSASAVLAGSKKLNSQLVNRERISREQFRQAVTSNRLLTDPCEGDTVRKVCHSRDLRRHADDSTTNRSVQTPPASATLIVSTTRSQHELAAYVERSPRNASMSTASVVSSMCVVDRSAGRRIVSAQFIG
ncbi:hypothetical protein KOR42_00610 [Thalassoglobus neptunius]|uniref:Uncharacterized protein n=1 Tax=Thalassoglobus neptunius TaxID=1938619 RepID=A0A5C5X139_9PLAN|nr:hypothetical protein KOR42_00610 [Thalassoglobus neptunius]